VVGHIHIFVACQNNIEPIYIALATTNVRYPYVIHLFLMADNYRHMADINRVCLICIAPHLDYRAFVGKNPCTVCSVVRCTTTSGHNLVYYKCTNSKTLLDYILVQVVYHDYCVTLPFVPVLLLALSTWRVTSGG
jgi:hypothetical protein